MRDTAPLGRLLGLLAATLVLVTAAEATSTSAVVVAMAAALVVSVGALVVVPRSAGGVGVLPGEIAVGVPVLSSRIADPVRQPVRPRAPGLV